MAHISLHAVTRHYGSITALDGVSLSFSPGVTVLLGRNGAGKSTVSRILAGAEAPTSGEVLRDGEMIDGTARRRHLAHTGWLPQDFAAPGRLSVSSYLAYAGWLKGLSGRRLDEQVRSALALVDLSARSRSRVGALSGGMMRRLGIAQAIVHDPDLLVLDEPTVGLDPEQRGRFHELLGSLARDRTIVLSTHLLEDVIAAGDGVTVLDQGAAVFSGTIAQLSDLAPAGDELSDRLRRAFVSLIGQRP